MRYVHRFIPVPALLFALSGASYAQSARRTVILSPFDFVAGGKTLPPVGPKSGAAAGRVGRPETATVAVRVR